MVVSLIVLSTNHPHGTHAVGSFTAKTWSCGFSLLLGFEHCLLRLLIAVMFRQGGEARYEQHRPEQKKGAFHQGRGHNGSLCR
tara:strand:- start:329 stop:577 length:249 start_codon:yes stop_codon:yes gene_type:complete